jgi:hypothetical protein
VAETAMTLPAPTAARSSRRVSGVDGFFRGGEPSDRVADRDVWDWVT